MHRQNSSGDKHEARWVIAFMNEGRLDGKQVVSPQLINQMVQHHVRVPGETDSYYTYGLTSFKYQGLEFIGHGGFSRGYGSMIQMVPTRKFAVIVLANRSGETMRKSLNKARCEASEGQVVKRNRDSCFASS